MTIESAPETVQTLIKDIRFAMLTTCRADGSLHSRPMTTQDSDSDETLWFFSGRNTEAACDIAANPQVNVSYSEPASQRFVSLCGRAVVVEDRLLLRERWRADFALWFPLGLADPNLILIKVTIERAQFWQSPASWFGRSLAFAKALVTGERAAIDHSGPVTLPAKGPSRVGAVNWTVLLWAIGVPVPIVLLVALFRGCS